MKSRRITGIVSAAAIAGALIAPAAIANADAGQQRTQALGNNSLASALTAHGNGKFDRNWNDYDIVTQAVLAVLKAKPDSPVKVLTQGGVRLTAFIPDDRSFRKLATDLTGSTPRTEKATFNALVAAVGVDAIEQVLQYHVIPGARINAKKALRSNGATLDTALPGASVTVTVADGKIPLIVLTDNDPGDVDPIVDPGALNLNKGNKQIAHGIIFVLRPADL
jgi:uncharacterized surface protein with fasciclin (FAS1) repeats